jgi:DNA polymerase-3 subunit beta
MEFRIDKNQLLRGLFLAAGIADRKATNPILANVLVRTEGKERILCAATDLQVTVSASLAASVTEEGGLTLGARQLHEIIKGLGGDDVHVRRTDQNWAEIKAGRAEFKLVGMTDRDYPKLPATSEATLHEVDAGALREMIGKTIFSASQDDTRPHLAGVLFECDGVRGRMVSTDGHRLSKVGRDLGGGPKLETGVLLPRKGVAEIRRLLEGRDGKVEIGAHQGHFVCRLDDITLSVKLSDAMFPPYEQVIPKDNDKVVVVGRDLLLDALKRVSLMSSDKTWGVRIGVEKGRLSIEADNPDLGAARENLDIPYKGGYFMDVLGEVAGPEVRLEMAGELDPAVIKPADGSDYVGVIMPMRL